MANNKKVVNSNLAVNKKTTQQRIGGNTAHGYATQQFIKHLRKVLYNNLKANGLSGSYINRKGKKVNSTPSKPVAKPVQPAVYNYLAQHFIPQVIHQNYNSRNVQLNGFTYKAHGVVIGKSSKVNGSMYKWLASNVPVSKQGAPLPKNAKFTALLKKHKPLK